MNMTSKEVAEKLEKLTTLTPETCCFDINYGQLKNRWWDKVAKDKENMSKQQYHVVGYFICRYYNGTGFKCNNQCNECYCNGDYKVENPKNNKPPKTLYNLMQRPEMYIWIIEALGILESDTLKDFIYEVEQETRQGNRRNISKIRNIVKRYNASWNVIEEKLNNL